eukprot:24234_5
MRRKITNGSLQQPVSFCSHQNQPVTQCWLIDSKYPGMNTMNPTVSVCRNTTLAEKVLGFAGSSSSRVYPNNAGCGRLPIRRAWLSSWKDPILKGFWAPLYPSSFRYAQFPCTSSPRRLRP